MWPGGPFAQGASRFLDASWHAPYSALGIRISAANGGKVRIGRKHTQIVPFDCTVIGVRILADVAGSIKFDVKRTSFASFPPVPASTLCPLDIGRPRISNSTFAEDRALFGWPSRALLKGELLTYEVLEATGIGSVTFTLIVSPNHQP